MRKGDWLQTYSGGRFWPFDPSPKDVCLEDVAHALAMQCRYGGHCKRFYSIAEHSVLMAEAAPLNMKLWALLHDGSEAYIQDINRSLKKGLHDYKFIEPSVQSAVYEHFGLVYEYEPKEIKVMDMRIVLDEREQNMVMTDDVWEDYSGLGPLGVELKFWSPEEAKRQFIDMFSILVSF